MLLRWTWVRRRSAAGDRGDLDGGVTLEAAGFTQSIGGTARLRIGKGRQVARLRPGWLLLTAGQPPVCEDRRGGRKAVLAPPVAPSRAR